MKKLSRFLMILFVFTAFNACDDPMIDESETTIDSIDGFSEELLAELIEINFLNEYGGLKYEQEVFYNRILTDINECDIEDKMVHMQIDENEIFDVDFQWDYSKNCSQAIMVYNDRFHNVHDDGSIQVVSSDNFKLNVLPSTSQSVSGNFEDHMYQYFQFSLRYFTFLKGTGGDETFTGTINFSNLTCTFNMDNGFTIDQEIDFRIRMNSSSPESDEIDQLGVIKQLPNGWEIKFENGGTYQI